MYFWICLPLYSPSPHNRILYNFFLFAGPSLIIWCRIQKIPNFGWSVTLRGSQDEPASSHRSSYFGCQRRNWNVHWMIFFTYLPISSFRMDQFPNVGQHFWHISWSSVFFCLIFKKSKLSCLSFFDFVLFFLSFFLSLTPFRLVCLFLSFFIFIPFFSRWFRFSLFVCFFLSLTSFPFVSFFLSLTRFLFLFFFLSFLDFVPLFVCLRSFSFFLSFFDSFLFVCFFLWLRFSFFLSFFLWMGLKLTCLKKWIKFSVCSVFFRSHDTQQRMCAFPFFSVSLT